MEVNLPIEYLVGNDQTINEINNSGMSIFDERTLTFLDLLSKTLMKNPEAKRFPDIITFAFWCRRANLLLLRENYSHELKCRIGLGVSFHIAPSNVAVNFAYSAVVALLAGNSCIVRIPSKEFPQIEIICRAFRKILEQCEINNTEGFTNRIFFIRYPRSRECNDYISKMCDIRVIWGGDQTINELRKSELRPRAREITFADRFSIALISSEGYIDSDNHIRIAEKFYNDTYLSDQNACTSPRFVIWFGNKKEEAKTAFWANLHDFLKNKYVIHGIQAVDKLTKGYMLGSYCPGSKYIGGEDNLITRVKVDKLSLDMIDHYGNSGFFIEYDAEDLNEIIPLCVEKLQTICYLGIEPDQIKETIQSRGCKGVDRIVPLGNSMDFSLIWDGYDLIRDMSRIMHQV